jgi:hypothetical protein
MEKMSIAQSDASMQLKKNADGDLWSGLIDASLPSENSYQNAFAAKRPTRFSRSCAPTHATSGQMWHFFQIKTGN